MKRTTRATAIYALHEDQQKNLPTNNLNTERYLAKFGYLAALSAQHSNRFFKAKRIKDDLMLTETYVDEVERSTIGILKQLDFMEITWDEKQKEKKKQRLRENIKKRVGAKDIVDQLLVKCKQHEGPLTSVHELRALVSNNSPDLKTFLRLELQYQRVTHQRDFDERRNLYKVNKVLRKK